MSRQCLFTVLCLCAFSTAALASDKSGEEIAKGAAELKKSHYRKALQHFDDATQADPADADANFFQGVALNRLGKFAPAYALFELVRKKGLAHPDLDFEAGWSLTGMKLYKEAIVRLTAYEEAHPGRGQTMEFMGRCQLALGEEEKAEAAFREALRRNPKLEATVNLYLAALEKRRGNPQAAAGHLRSVIASDTPVARAFREEAETLRAGRPRPAEEKPWRVDLSATGGYNDNVIALGNTIPLPPDISGKDSPFTRLTAEAAYDFRLSSKGVLTAGYAFLADIYPDLSAADTLDHTGYLNYRHAIDERWSAALLFSEEFTQVGGKDFRNQATVRPALSYRLGLNASVELSYARSEAEYLFPVTAPVLDRDGHSDSAALLYRFNAQDLGLRGSVGYTHTSNAADGADFDFEADSASLRLAKTLPWDILAEAAYNYSDYRYNNPNSFAGAGFAFKRGDAAHGVSAGLSRPINKQSRLFLRYSRTRTDSNISVFDYEQNVWNGGVEVRF